ncbi:PREDICTED: multiple C2 and transmembrane domain-containing protein 2-like [Fragaria vesca subsp. vesca]
MERSNLKLKVEVVSARNLLPKDGQGSAGAFAELQFDHQNFQTTTKENGVDPAWNESFYFNISDREHLPSLTLEATVYHHNEPNSKSFLGKVCLPGTSFVSDPDAVVLRYHPLRKRSILSSRVRGELGLKALVTYDHGQPLPTPNQPQQQQNVPRAPINVPHNSGTSSSKSYDCLLKETSPVLGGGEIVRGRFIAEKQVSPYNLVETMHYLFVRIVKVRDLHLKNITGTSYVSLKIGYYKGNTKPLLEHSHNPEWNQVFAIKREHMQSPVMDVLVKHYSPENNNEGDQFEGALQINIHEVHPRVSPNSPLAPKWYAIADKNGDKNGDLMLAVWKGTQADEAFPDAWHSDAPLPPNVSSVTYEQIRSKVYHTPRLWYIRVNVTEAQLFEYGMSRVPNAYAQLQIGNQCLKTKAADSEGPNSICWNEEMVFVAAEPFDDEHLIVSVEYAVGPEEYKSFGSVSIPLNSVERYEDDRTICGKWFNLEKSIFADVMGNDAEISSSKIHLCVCLDGGCNVLNGPTKQLGSPIGVLELGVIAAGKLLPMKSRKGRGTSDPYCVAKYGDIWFRTRTIVDSLNPKFNEPHNWDVYDPATVLTVAIFDNQIDGDSDDNKHVEIGKVQIPVSTLESGRIYTLLYPLISLSSSGLNKKGELHVAVRFSYTSFINMMFTYSQPPWHVNVCEQAVSAVAAHFGQAEAPLQKEVVQCMYSDVNSHVWSLRRSKANFFRVMSVLSAFLAVGKWFEEVCMWKNPITTALVHVLFVMLVCTPELIFPTVFLYMFAIGAWNFRYRPTCPPHTDIKFSHADSVHPDELDEEFDTFPTSRERTLTMMRYDRLRSIAGRIQTMLGDIVIHGERIQELLSWRDPRVTTLCITLCLVCAIISYVTPFKAIVILVGFYLMRHPWFRSKTPPILLNVLERLPAKTDCMLTSSLES